MPKTKETKSSNKFSWDHEYGSLLPPCAVWHCSFMLSQWGRAGSFTHAKEKLKERQHCLLDSSGISFFTDLQNVTMPSYAEFCLIQISYVVRQVDHQQIAQVFENRAPLHVLTTVCSHLREYQYIKTYTELLYSLSVINGKMPVCY